MKYTFIVALVLAIMTVFPAPAQDGNDNTRLLVESISSTVTALEADIANLDKGIEDADYVLKNGEQMFDDLISSTEAVLSSINESSETWASLTAVIGDFEEQQSRVTKLAAETNDQRLRTVAQLWGEKAREAASLRNEISTERARTRSLLDGLKQERLIVVEYLKLGAAQQVIDSMRAVRENLTSVNENLRKVGSRAEQLAAGEVQN